jgi:hypothetical protein
MGQSLFENIRGLCEVSEVIKSGALLTTAYTMWQQRQGRGDGRAKVICSRQSLLLMESKLHESCAVYSAARGTATNNELAADYIKGINYTSMLPFRVILRRRSHPLPTLPTHLPSGRPLAGQHGMMICTAFSAKNRNGSFSWGAQAATYCSSSVSQPHT